MLNNCKRVYIATFQASELPPYQWFINLKYLRLLNTSTPWSCLTFVLCNMSKLVDSSFSEKRKLNLIFYQHFWVGNFIMCKCHRVTMIIFVQDFFFVLVSDWYNRGCIIMSIFLGERNQTLLGYVILCINLTKLFAKINFTTWFCALWKQKFSTLHDCTFK